MKTTAAALLGALALACAGAATIVLRAEKNPSRTSTVSLGLTGGDKSAKAKPKVKPEPKKKR